MKIIILLFAMLLGFGLACKETFDSRELIAKRTSSEVMPLNNHQTLHPQVIAAV
ncbi:hypothetical protein [Pontibacter vulgaris]|uniref:hypothetical protein n=1 Tax=Pontibacter vulgaris TaxID=2905679 RepID=UPI001FA71052|nr:hypothetical protein [Pontibacter vulgaris]